MNTVIEIGKKGWRYIPTTKDNVCVCFLKPLVTLVSGRALSNLNVSVDCIVKALMPGGSIKQPRWNHLLQQVVNLRPDYWQEFWSKPIQDSILLRNEWNRENGSDPPINYIRGVIPIIVLDILHLTPPMTLKWHDFNPVVNLDKCLISNP